MCNLNQHLKFLPMKNQKLDLLKYTILFIFIFHYNSGYSQLFFPTNSGTFNKIEKGELDKAHDDFQKILKKDTTSLISRYGLALIYSDNKFKSYNLDTAYIYASQIQYFIKDSINQIWSKQIAKNEMRDIEKLKINPEKIKSIKDSILIKIYNVTSSINEISSYKQFISKYPNASQVKYAWKNIYSLAFKAASDENTIKAFAYFIKSYPEAKQVNDAQDRIHSLAYKLAFETNSIQSLKQFIHDYPKASQISEAKIRIEELAYILAKKENTLKSYKEFIENYPNSLRKEEINQFTNQLLCYLNVISLVQNYQLIESYYNGFAIFTNSDKKGFIDELGKEIIPARYDYIFPFSNGLASVQTSKITDTQMDVKCGYVDRIGKEVVPLLYSEADPLQEGLARVVLNGKYGFKDSTGTDVFTSKYDRAGNFHEGLAYVSINGNVGFIDKTGKIVIPLKYEFNEDSYFKEGLARVNLNERFGFIDKTGKVVIPLKYDLVFEFNEGFAPVKIKDLWNFIDKTGKLLISQFKYDGFGGFSEGMAKVGLKGKYGFIDNQGNERIPVKYDSEGNFSEGLAKVQLNEKWGYIDKQGKEIVPIKYDDASEFKEGIAKVKLAYRYGYIDKTGKEIIPIDFNVINDSYSWVDSTLVGYYVVNYNEKWFLMTLNVKTKKNMNEEKFKNALIVGMDKIEKMNPEQQNNQISHKTQTTNELEFLRDSNGKYIFDLKLFENPIIKKRLANFIGDKLDYVKSIWETENPITINDGIFYSQAMQAHSGGDPGASFVVDLNKDVIYIGIRKAGKVEYFSEDGSKIPRCLAAWGNDYY